MMSLLALAMPALAEPVGNLLDIAFAPTREGTLGWNITTDTGARVRIDSCRDAGGQQFQIWGDGRLLYGSGLVKAPGVVKPELDIRSLRQLSLRTLGAQGPQPAQVCGNWANAVLIGQEGDTARIAPL